MFLTSGSAAIHKFLLPTNDDDGDDKEDQVIIYNDDDERDNPCLMIGAL